MIVTFKKNEMKKDRKKYMIEYYSEHKEKENASSKIWYNEHKEERKEYMKIYKIDNKEKRSITVRRNNLKKKFGITWEEYDELFKKQNGYCPICGRHQSEFKKRLSVDHDHNTKKVRGLLCQNCNI